MNIKKHLSVEALIGLAISLGLVGGSLCLMLTTGAMLAFWPALGLFLALTLGIAGLLYLTGSLSKTITGIAILITGLACVGAGATIAVIGALPTFGLSLLMGAILGTVGLIMLGDSVAFFTKSQPKDGVTQTPYPKNAFSTLANYFFLTVTLAFMGAAIAILATTTGAVLLTYWPAFVLLVALSAGVFMWYRSLYSMSQMHSAEIRDRIFYGIMLFSGIALIGTAVALLIPGILPTLGLSILASVFIGLSGIVLSFFGAIYTLKAPKVWGEKPTDTTKGASEFSSTCPTTPQQLTDMQKSRMEMVNPYNGKTFDQSTPSSLEARQVVGHSATPLDYH